MLAGKVEETPKKVRDIVKTARSLLSDADFEQFGNDPRVCSIFISLNFLKIPLSSLILLFLGRSNGIRTSSTKND